MITKQVSGAASGVAAGANVGQKTRSYALAYTISEALSVNVGTETIDAPARYKTLNTKPLVQVILWVE